MDVGSIYSQREKWIGGYVMWRIGTSVHWAEIIGISKFENKDEVVMISTQHTTTLYEHTSTRTVSGGKGAYLAERSTPLYEISGGALAFDTTYIGPTIFIPQGKDPEVFIPVISAMETKLPPR